MHGSTLMNLNVFNSTFIKEKFDAHYFSLSLNKDMNDLGRVKFYKLKKIIRDYFNLARTLKKVKPSLVYFAVSPVGFAFIKDFIFFSIIKMHRVPVVFHHHGKGVKLQGEKNGLFNFFYKKMFRPSYHICLAQELVADLSPYLSTEPSIVPNGIKDEISGMSLNGKEASPCKILYLSNFTVNKGILDVIDACKILKDQNFNFQVSLAGKPYDITEDELAARIHDAGLDGFVKIVGPKYGEEKFKIFHDSDFFVFPTKYEREAFPLVILEAMQAGLPVISTSEGGIPSIIDDSVHGYLIDKNDITGLANKMGCLIKHPDMVKQMGKKAREKYESYYTLEKFEHCLGEAIDSTLKKLETSDLS